MGQPARGNEKPVSVITVQDIRERAAEWQLSVDTVEKDYVLGWLLAAVGMHPVAGIGWIFKGGTSLKKCYVETYRFSEDLDFSLEPGTPYSQDALEHALRELTQNAADMSGIDFPTDRITVRERHDKLGRTTFQARVYYRGASGDALLPQGDFRYHEA